MVIFQCLIKTPDSPNCKTIPRRSGLSYIPPPIHTEHELFVVRIWAIGEGRAGHGQQVWVWGHQGGLLAQEASTGAAQAAVAGQRGSDQCSCWGAGQRLKVTLRQTECLRERENVGALTGELWNDGRRVLVQVVHTACDGVRGDRDSGHDDPAVVWVEAGRQARQTWIIDDGEAAELLDLLPTVEPLPQAGGHFWQRLPTERQSEAELNEDDTGSMRTELGKGARDSALMPINNCLSKIHSKEMVFSLMKQD